MSIDITKKLDFLMYLTNIKNNTLANAIHFDPSFISRIRNGKRGISKYGFFIERVANYFARIIKEPHQKNILSQRILNGAQWSENVDESAKILTEWLTSGEEFSFEDTKIIKSPTIEIKNNESVKFFYGNEGKRASVEEILKNICDLDNPPTLLLSSDENMKWLYEDKNFSLRWANYLKKFSSNGGKIKIIHNIKRDVGEMLEAIKKWLPLYTMKAIEPYYCPKVRDNIYRRTIFIAQNHSALISNSIGDTQREMLNLIINDINAVRALENEFNDYLSICRPLLKFFNAQNIEELFQTFDNFHKAKGNIIRYAKLPSLYNMPSSVAKSIANRQKSKRFIKKNIELQKIFFDHLDSGFNFSEILMHSENFDRIIPFSDLFGMSGLCYNSNELNQHLDTIKNLVKKYDNYHVVTTDHYEDFNLLVKENFGCFLYNDSPPSYVLYTSEQDITSAIYEYLYRLLKLKNI